MREWIGGTIIAVAFGLLLHYAYSIRQEVGVLEQEIASMTKQLEKLTTEVESYSGKMLRILQAVDPRR